MTTKLSQRDLEALSAYLDGQLSSRQQRKLERRLQADESLQLALDDLKRTRAALRAMPQLRAPRQFTLTPEMAGQQIRSSGLYPTMRLASALATILFVVVTFGDVIASNANQFAPANLQAQPVVDDAALVVEPTLIEELPTATVPEDVEAEPDVEMFALPAEGDDGVGSPADESGEAPLPAFGNGMEPTQPVVAAESAAEADAEDLQEQQAEEFAPQPTQLPAPTATTMVLGETERSAAETQVAGLDDSPVPTQGFVAQPPVDKGLEPAVQAQEPSLLSSLPLIRIVEIVLAALAVILGIFALYLRRRA